LECCHLAECLLAAAAAGQAVQTETHQLLLLGRRLEWHLQQHNCCCCWMHPVSRWHWDHQAHLQLLDRLSAAAVAPLASQMTQRRAWQHQALLLLLPLQLE
jgi:hypothetical protein